MTIYVGIDVSKKTLDVAWVIDNMKNHFKVPNSLQGFKNILKSCPKSAHFVMEATGSYYTSLAFFLSQKSQTLSVINPLVIKRFGQMNLKRAKTDKADAHLIAEYGRRQQPSTWIPPKAETIEMQQLWALSDSLVKQTTILKNQKEAFTTNIIVCKSAVEGLNKIILALKKEHANAQKKIQQIIEKSFARENEILRIIPGIGAKASAALIIVSKGFTPFENNRKLCSFLGTNPKVFESGISVKGKPSISKIGMTRVRAVLYMCSLTAIKRNAACKNLYDRLDKMGKPRKVSLVAVMNKLIRQAHTMIIKDQLFNEKLALNP